jgi:DNA polymerase III gamma/tau subunit
MHSYLITGGSYENRKEKERDLCLHWNVQPYDMLQIGVEKNKQSIGIEEIRVLTHTLSLSPRVSPVVVGIIDQAEKLTLEAQHALLKTLEEPPPKARIILETGNASVLLPTISSRCQIVQSINTSLVSEDEKTNTLKTLQNFQGKKPGEIVRLVSQLFEKKEEGVQFLQSLLYILHELLHNSQKGEQQDEIKVWNSHHIRHMIRSVIQAQKFVSANVQYTLVFDDFFQTILLYKG